MGGWGLRHTPASKELSVRAKILEDGGLMLWSEFMEELRHLHLEAPAHFCAPHAASRVWVAAHGWLWGKLGSGHRLTT